MEKTPEQKRDEVLSFFKEAMCVDGPVRFAEKEENAKLNEHTDRWWIRLEDSKRGVFFLATDKLEA